MPADNYGDPDGDPTIPEMPTALLAQAVERFRAAANSICRAIPLLSSIDGDREYLAARLAEDIIEFGESAKKLAFAVRVAYPR